MHQRIGSAVLHRSRRARTGRVWLAIVAAVAGGTFVAGTSNAAPAGAAASVRDGSSSALAAPSCWAVKQLNPANTSGVYWLQTARLIAPAQFYCDQSTDGGGWVLVGRGRDGWTWSDRGQGSPTALRTTTSGTAAFTPAALPTATVTGLLDGGRVDALPDGIRVTRATDPAAVTRQELRITPTARSAWSWAFGGGIRFSGLAVNGVASGSGTTNAWRGDDAYAALYTATSAAHGYRMGFGFGSTVTGTNASTSAIWSYAGEGRALPFAQVWLRPKLLSSTFAAIPSTGLPASTVRPMMSDVTSTATPWGVTGVHGTGEAHVEVEAFAQVGTTMFVGGDFSYVQKGANPGAGEKVAQPYLAAFDVSTGAWISSFRPQVNGTVWDLQALPNGLLAVGGQFTQINGAATALTVLDPRTGAIVAGWSGLKVGATNATATTPATVRALDVQGGWLYVGGRFNQVSGGTPKLGPLTVARLARVQVTDGKPDANWRPNLDGSVIELDAAPAGDRVYVVGYFAHLNGTASPNEGALSTSAGAAFVTGLKPWVPSTGSGVNTYQQTIKDAGNGTIWQGGSQHILSQYTRSDYTRKTSYITKSGGDLQTIAVAGGVVYASCHCNNYIYTDSTNFTDPITAAADVHNINYIAAFDAATGALIPSWYPVGLAGRIPIGAWELQVDTSGCMWFGGDFTRGSNVNGSYLWLGGFGKFCVNDSTAPSRPAGVQVSVGAQSTTLSWSPSTDAGGSVSYEVLRNDRVIATTASTSFTDAGAPSPASYVVRAVDRAGNRSATTAPATS